MSDPTPENIPAPVIAAYYEHSATITATRLPGGEINATWMTVDKEAGCKAVLQRISPIFGRLMLRDMQMTTDALAEQEGWEVPRVILARDGRAFVEEDDGSYRWRMTTFIESDLAPSEVGPADCHAYGRLLAQTHQSLARIEYEPQFELAGGNFHNTDYYIGELEKVAGDLPDAESRQFARGVLRAYEGLPALPEGPQQLLHGDPRTNNMLFRGGRPFTYIDWDTVMKGSIWVDVGDLMRSLVEDSLLKRGQPLEIEKLRACAEGYRETAMPNTSPEQFFGWALTAMKRIALELTSRFAADINGSYFAVDPAMTRRDNHMLRAGTQWQIYNAYNKVDSAVSS